MGFLSPEGVFVEFPGLGFSDSRKIGGGENLMLVDKMEYQGQQGGGGAQDDAFYELLSSTAMANAKKHQQQQQQQQHHQHHSQQFEQQQAFESRIEEPVLPSYDFQQNSSSSYGGVVSNGDDAGPKAPVMAPVVSSYPSGSPFQVINWVGFEISCFVGGNPNFLGV